MSNHSDSDSERSTSSFASNESGDEDDEVKKLHRLVQTETLHVQSWRRIVLSVLFVVSVIVIACTFFFLRRSEEASFEESFHLMAGTIEEAIDFELKETSGAMKDLSNVLSGHVQDSNNDVWPMVTLPNFEAFVQHTRQQTLSDFIAFSPIVNASFVETWNDYSVANQGWIVESLEYTGEEGSDPDPIPEAIYREGADTSDINAENCDGNCSPVWQMSPPPKDTSLVNLNIFSYEEGKAMFEGLVDTRDIIFGLADGDLASIAVESGDPETPTQKENPQKTPCSSLAYPVFNLPSSEPEFPDSSAIVGVAWAVFPWDLYLQNLVQDGVPGVYAVVHNSCGQSFTFLLEGTNARFLGQGDLHDTSFNDLRVNIGISDAFAPGEEKGGCRYAISVYPSSALKESFETNIPLVFTLVVASACLFIVLTFTVYDGFVRKKDNLLIKAAAQSNRLVSSLFPSAFRDRVIPKFGRSEDDSVAVTVSSTHRNLLDFMNGGAVNSEGDEEDFMFKTKPIADLFPEATIVFADLVGFTAWSSVREPAQVFTLLETIYGAFDAIARKRRVFKVETIGDCYVAVTGLPEPRKDHALAMARFALDGMRKMAELTKSLETTLGPDTADLSMRIGLHSGPVTAGVLRGERARFQLFGDTMNMAATIESTGTPGRIHLSQETADHLISAGKQHWIKKREDPVNAKGKGEIQTYWLTAADGTSNSRSSGSANDDSVNEKLLDIALDDWDGQEILEDGKVLRLMDEKTERLVNWNVEVLSSPLKEIAARRKLKKNGKCQAASSLRLPAKPVGKNTLDEVKEIIQLPRFDAKAPHVNEDVEGEALDPRVISELREYVNTVASLYHENAFHNFEHASHVSMSTVKLLSRIVSSPSKIDAPESAKGSMASVLHHNSYGITSDPLIQFACIFSALIHDVDHAGVSNAQLVKERSHIAALYKGKSVAEQNSVDLAWELLFSDDFDRLRAAIYADDVELRRFRQLVVNSVMATDILDRDLKTLRNARWDRAFSDQAQREPQQDTVNRKATIVIEHLIQASDVSHTMQHWHVYRKWNECLFKEQVHAFKEGRVSEDPASSWYEGEIGFFDYYIIPLAKKLKDCGVFGVSSDEYLNYAMKNRSEWEVKGKEIVAEMVAQISDN